MFVRMFSRISTILFDLDGTIADTNEIIQRTMLETLEFASGRPWQREALLPNWGMRLRDQLLLLYPDMQLEHAVPFYRQRYAEYHRTLLAEFPGMRATLAQLHAAGFTLGVVTSKKQASARQTVEDIGYADFFSVLVAEEDSTRHKPAPDPILVALTRLGVTADEAVYVGDNPDDVRAAHAAGVRAIAVGWGVRPRSEFAAVQPHAIIDSPRELYHLLGVPIGLAAEAP